MKPLHTLVAYQMSIQLVEELRPIVERIRRLDRNVADQLKRAASSVVLNIAEGQRREAGNKQRAYEIANGEASEVLGCLDLARAWGWRIDDREARETLDRLLRLLHGLVKSSAPVGEAVSARRAWGA